MSLIDAYATGRVKPSHDDITKHIRETYLSRLDPRNPHWSRRKRVAQRLRFYEDCYDEDTQSLIRMVFENERVIRQRRRLADLAKPLNVTRRIIDEVSAVYDKPAKRMLPDDDAQNAYDQIARDLSLHEMRNEQHRLTNLCNEVLIWCYKSSATGDVLMRTVTPDAFDAIPDPRDALSLAGILLDAAPAVLAGQDRDVARMPHMELWDDTFVYRLDADGLMTGPPEAHGLGRIPGYLQHRRKPRTTLLDSVTGGDIISAHSCVVLLNLMIMRLAISQGEKQPVLSGNLARVATGQAFDGVTPVALPPGVAASMLDSRTDPGHYLDAIKHYIGGVAATYGMSYEQFTANESVMSSSGKAYQVRREKLTEIRDQQVLRSETDEAEIALLLSEVRASHQLSTFDPSGLVVAFSDPRIPQDAGEELSLLKTGVEMGTDSVIRHISRKLSLSREQAEQFVLQNVNDRAKLVVIMRALNIPGEATDAGQDPADNGATGGRPPEDEAGDGQVLQ